MNSIRELQKQLDFLISSCRIYDEGRHEEAIRIGVTLRTMFHSTKKSRSLVIDHLGLGCVRMRSTTRLGTVAGDHFLGFLGLDTSTGTFRPYLDDGRQNHFLPVLDWWATEAVLRLVPHQITVTRKEIACTAANTDGGAHVDKKKTPFYELLSEGLNIATTIKTREGSTMSVVYRNANLAALRQIAHEVLSSKELTERATYQFGTNQSHTS